MGEILAVVLGTLTLGVCVGAFAVMHAHEQRRRGVRRRRGRIVAAHRKGER